MYIYILYDIYIHISIYLYIYRYILHETEEKNCVAAPCPCDNSRTAGEQYHLKKAHAPSYGPKAPQSVIDICLGLQGLPCYNVSTLGSMYIPCSCMEPLDRWPEAHFHTRVPPIQNADACFWWMGNGPKPYIDDRRPSHCQTA